ncbi:MAG: hypothetical protein ACYS8W_16010, partial [Planctomycetota bacterium]
MRRAVIFVFTAALLLTLPVLADEFKPGDDTNLSWVPFNPNFENLVEKSKPGIIYIYSAKAVELCKHFETEIFADKGVKNRAKKFICIKVNGDDKPDIAKKFNINPGEAAIVFVSIFGKVDDTLKSKSDPDAIEKALKKAYDFAKKDSRKASAVEKAWKKAEAYAKRKRMKEAVQIWELIVKEMGDLPHPLVEATKKKLEQLEKDGLARLKPALDSGKQTADRYRNYGRGMGAGNVSGLKQGMSACNQAISRIKEILEQYPLTAVTQ